MKPTSRAGEAVPRISENLRKKHHGTDGLDALNFAMDLLRVTAIALVEARDGALSDKDILSAGYLVMNAVDALTVTHASLSGEANQ